jgi:tetratricopeptide (TPR) repeat protein
LPVPELPSRESYQRTPLSAEEIKVHLAGVALRTAGSAAATIALLEAGRAEQPDPRIFESLGAEAWQREAIEDAVEHWSRAREHGSTNASILRELARHEWERWFVRAAMELRLPAEVATNLRDLLISGLELEPETDQAWEMLAWVEACSPQVSGKNVNAVQARIPTLKEKASTLTAIALCYVRVGNEAAAIELLEQLPRFEPDDWTLDGAEYALAKLKKVPREMISLGNNSALRHVGVHQVRENSTHYPSVPIPEGL